MLSVGEILQKERIRLALKLSDVEKQIKVREKFLTAVEENNWGFFTSKIYVSGIIKNYSQYLGLDPKKTLAFFRRDYEKKEVVRFKRKIASRYLTPETRRIAMFALFLIFFVFFGYFAFQLKQYFSPPKVSILLPLTQNTKEDRIKLIGKTDRDSAVTVMGDQVFQSKEGIFEYIIPLREGKNEVVIEVICANGKKTVVKRVFMREEK